MPKFVGTAGADTLRGTSEADLIRGRGGDDLLLGGSGSDILEGGSGDDTLHGGTGRDFLYGGNGNDALFGGAGADFLYGGRDPDTLTGGTGDDTFLFDWADAKFSTGNITDIITDFEVGDTLKLTGFSPIDGDLVFGQVGNDVLVTFRGTFIIIDASGSPGATFAYTLMRVLNAQVADVIASTDADGWVF